MSQNDYVFIDDIEVACHIGTTAEERAFPQLIRISIRAFLPLRSAGINDDLKQSVDYAHIVRDVSSLVADRTFNLVEAVAEAAAGEALKAPLVNRVVVRVEKRIIPGTRAVGVEILRTREGV